MTLGSEDLSKTLIFESTINHKGAWFETYHDICNASIGIGDSFHDFLVSKTH